MALTEQVRALCNGVVETMGRVTYEGKVKHPVTAHPKVDAETGMHAFLPLLCAIYLCCTPLQCHLTSAQRPFYVYHYGLATSHACTAFIALFTVNMNS